MTIFRAVSGLYLEVSFGVSQPAPFLYQLLTGRHKLLPIRNNETEMGQALTSQAKPPDTEYLQS